MTKRFDPFILIGTLIIGVPLLAAMIGACVVKTEDMPDPEAKSYNIGNTHIQEIHPKPGITCFVYTTYGISCIKD